MAFLGPLSIREVLAVYLITLVIGNLMISVQAIIGLFIQALFNHYFNTYAARFVEPITSFLIGGPTFNAINAIYRVTPILNPSVLGERLDTMIQIMGGSAVTSLTIVATNFVESIFRTCIDISIAVGIAASNAISTIAGSALESLGRSLKIDYVQSGPRLKNDTSRDGKRKSGGVEPLTQSKAMSGRTTKPRIISKNIAMPNEPNYSHSNTKRVDSDLRKTVDFSSMDRSNRRIYPEREKASQSPYDVTSELLERNPLLERFLEAVHLDEDDCLKEIICSINSSADENMTKEEINFKVDFRTLTKKYKTIFPSLTSFVTASNTGEKAKTLKACQATYPKCKYPLLARALFIYLSRFTSHR